MKIGRVMWDDQVRAIVLDSVHAARPDMPEAPEAGAAAPTGGELLDCSVAQLYAEFGELSDLHAELPGVVDQHRTGERIAVTDADLLAPVEPGKVICVGLNYAKHITEMGHPQPDVPTLFAKFPDALTGPYDDLPVPAAGSDRLDYEGEYAFVIGKRALHVSEAEAAGYIAGEMIINDFTQRDKQYATEQWLQGKTLEKCSGCGPWVRTVDGDSPLAGAPEKRMLRTWVNGELRQEAPLSDLVFRPAELVSYISQFVALNPGDVIATGTPAGVGHGMKTYLADGDVVRIAIDTLGEISNTVRVQ